MADDIFDRITSSDIEFRNEIEYPTNHENDSLVFIHKNKFSVFELNIIFNTQFEITPEIKPLKGKKKKDKKNYPKNILSKKRGRQTNNNGKKWKKNIHNRICPCNIRTKLTIAYISFLEQFINSAIDLFLREEDNINQYKIKKVFHSNKINIKLIKELKQKTIKEIISGRISPKYLSSEKEENEKICKTIIEKNKELEILLNHKYMKFFEIFYTSQKEVNLKQYGVNKSLFLNSNVILYNDFINNIKKKGGSDLDDYLKKIEEVVAKYLKL